MNIVICKPTTLILRTTMPIDNMHVRMLLSSLGNLSIDLILPTLCWDVGRYPENLTILTNCLLYTSDAADEL